MDLAVTMRGFENKSSTTLARDCVLSLSHVIPRWIYAITIRRAKESHEDPDVAAIFEPFIEYHEACITLYPHWFNNLNDAQQRETIAHELSHAFSAHLCDLVEKELLTIAKQRNGVLADHLRRDYERLQEEMTQEIALALLRVIGDK